MGPIFLAVYIKFRKQQHQTWGGWSFESLTEWWQYARLGVPGFLIMACEWWTFQAGNFVLGTIDEIQLAINAVILQYVCLLYMVNKLVLYNS